MLRYGKETGSVVNHMYSRMGFVVPEIGMGATLLHWTDRDACTVIRVFEIHGDPAVEVQMDKAFAVVPDYREDQDYEYVQDPEGRTEVFRWRGDTWECVRLNTETKRWRISGGSGLVLGTRRTYRDPCF